MERFNQDFVDTHHEAIKATLKKFNVEECHINYNSGREPVIFLQFKDPTNESIEAIREELKKLCNENDVLAVFQINNRRLYGDLSPLPENSQSFDLGLTNNQEQVVDTPSSAASSSKGASLSVPTPAPFPKSPTASWPKTPPVSAIQPLTEYLPNDPEIQQVIKYLQSDPTM